MLKGLIALFTTGLILNPCLLLGGLLGIISYVGLSDEHLKALYLSYQLYLLFLLFSFGFVYFFKKTLKDNEIDIDWIATSKTVFSQFLLMSFSFIMGMLLASFFDFSDFTPSKENYQYSEISETLSIQKQAEDMVKNYNNMLDSIK